MEIVWRGEGGCILLAVMWKGFDVMLLKLLEINALSPIEFDAFHSSRSAHS